VKFEQVEPVSFKTLPEGSEKIIQQLIADDPSVLTLGPLLLRAAERTQPSGGRLDLLLQDEDGTSWYEVEVQLGETDPSHIIRTIEYWDRERRRYPDIQHTAVIVAEEITGRFFNVINLFNQSIPIIALKFTVLRFGDQYGVVFTKVLDYEPRGIETEDEIIPKADRSYWEQRSSSFSLKALDQLIEYCRETIDPTIESKFNKPYIGTTLKGRVSNFVTFVPQKRALRLSIHCKQTEDADKQLEDKGIDWVYKGGAYPGYRLRLAQNDISESLSLVKGLIVQAFKNIENEPTIAQKEDSANG
jgi:predicted transport protein